MQFVKESIFVSAIRSFFNALLAMIGVLIGVGMLAGMGMALSGKGPAATPDDQISIEVLPDADGKILPLTQTTPIILQIDVDGVIGMDNHTCENYMNYLRLSRHSPLIKSEQIKGVLINIQSPGGVVSDSDITYNAIADYKKKYNVPVYAYGSLLCASGGYLIACAADKIYTSRTCLVGSVGVKTGPFFNFAGLMDKHGVKAIELSAGKDKIKYPQFTPIPQENGKDSTKSYRDLSIVTEQFYEMFTDVVDNSRKEAGLTKSQLVNQYGAQVFIGEEAQRLGYVDNGDASRDIALDDLARAAGIEQGTNYHVIRLKHRRSPLQSLVTSSVKMWTMRATEWLTGVRHQGSLDGKILYMYDPAD